MLLRKLDLPATFLLPGNLSNSEAFWSLSSFLSKGVLSFITESSPFPQPPCRCPMVTAAYRASLSQACHFQVSLPPLSQLGGGTRTGKAGLEVKKNKERTFVFRGWVMHTNLGSQEPGSPHNYYNRGSLSRALAA